MNKPQRTTRNKCFSSGPCAKRPGWTIECLGGALVGRSHRSKDSMDRIGTVLDKTRKILGIPESYHIGLTPGSDTGAVEMALWNLMGPKTVDVIYFEEFGRHWFNDIKNQLKIECREFGAEFGSFPDLSGVDFNNDVVMTSNGTTSGVCIYDYGFIPDDRKGLVICDATSGIFSTPMDFYKLDVVTYSWQKCLGGEAQHGVIVFSPRAIDRLASYVPSWPIPKLFNIKNKGLPNMDFFKGSTINTPSMIAIEDALDSLSWVEKIGGLLGAHDRVAKNFHKINTFIEGADYLENLCTNPNHRSRTSVCFKIVADWFVKMDLADQKATLKSIEKILSENDVARDIVNHKAAPSSLRVWCGPTIDDQDVEILCEWIDYAYKIIAKNYGF